MRLALSNERWECSGEAGEVTLRKVSHMVSTTRGERLGLRFGGEAASTKKATLPCAGITGVGERVYVTFLEEVR